MTTALVSATEASQQLFVFPFNGGTHITPRDIRYLEDNLTVIHFYLKQKRAELEHDWKKRSDAT